MQECLNCEQPYEEQYEYENSDEGGLSQNSSQLELQPNSQSEVEPQTLPEGLPMNEHLTPGQYSHSLEQTQSQRHMGFCSHECYEQFERWLKNSRVKSIELGLLDADGNVFAGSGTSANISKVANSMHKVFENLLNKTTKESA